MTAEGAEGAEEPVGAQGDEETGEPAGAAGEEQGAGEETVGETGPVGERELEKAFARLEKEAERHAAAVSRIMGEDSLELLVCELCWPPAPGFRFPGELEPEQRDAVLAAIGLAGDAAYAKAIDARACDKCNALGRVLTGSLVAEHRTKMCPACNGTGYVNVPGRTPSNGAGELAYAPSPVPDAPAEPPPDVDPWGRAPSDPNYGRMPQYVR